MTSPTTAIRTRSTKETHHGACHLPGHQVHRARYVPTIPTVAVPKIANAPSKLFGWPTLFGFIQQQKLSTDLLHAT